MEDEWMKSNLLLHGIPEVNGENCNDVIKSFLQGRYENYTRDSNMQSILHKEREEKTHPGAAKAFQR